MTYNADQVMNGLKSYVEAEVMGSLPTSGKWVVGTIAALATMKAHEIIEELEENQFATMLGIIDENGNIEVDDFMEALRESAMKYGKLSIDIPLIGRMTFSQTDIDKLRMYIN